MLIRARCRITTAAIGFVLLWSLTVIARGDTNLPPPRGHVNDFAGVLDDASRERLENILENLKQRSGIDFVIATVQTSGAKDLYDYSLSVANDWNVGSQNSAEKTLLTLIATDTGRFFTQSSQSAQKDLPTGLIGYMGRRMRPQFQEAKYSEGLLTGIQAFVSILGERLNLTFEALDQKSGAQASALQTLGRSSATLEKTQPAKTRPQVETSAQVGRASETAKTAITAAQNESRLKEGIQSSERPAKASTPKRPVEIASAQAAGLKPSTNGTEASQSLTNAPNQSFVNPSAPKPDRAGSIASNSAIAAAPKSALNPNSAKRTTTTGVLYGQVVDTLGGLARRSADEREDG